MPLCRMSSEESSMDIATAVGLLGGVATIVILILAMAAISQVISTSTQ